MSLVNIPPWKRTGTDIIQLEALCFEKQFGFPAVLKVILDDIMILLYFSDPEEGTPIYFVYVGRKQVNMDGCENFDVAFKECYALYFIMNLQDPKGICLVLELIQRMCLEIHQDAGSEPKNKEKSIQLRE
ncbi:hypothetical protein JTB14_001889 [Gonioctena quinquepunctata]|nr:hypothetical protein JTB14_001889 [Gonioctena quinquepunctata]